MPELEPQPARRLRARGPGTCITSTRPTGCDRGASRAPGDRRSRDSSTIFAWMVPPIPDRRRRLAVERELRRPRRPTRGSASPPADTQPDGTRRRRRARAGRPAARTSPPDRRYAEASGPCRDDMQMLVVCLPTYNERDNLERMLRALGDVFARTDLDGPRPRDRRRVARRHRRARRSACRESSPSSRCSTAPRRRGSGPPTWPGFAMRSPPERELVARDGLRFLARPRGLPRLVAAAARRRPRARVALRERRRHPKLGCRPAGRLSRAGCLYARVLLGLPVRDLTGGFKCFRRERLERIELDRISSKGYAFQIETTYRAVRAGFQRRRRFRSSFRTDREVGGSKMSGGDRARGALEGSRSLRLAGAARGRL